MQDQGPREDERLLRPSVQSLGASLEQEVVLALKPATPLWAWGLLAAAVFAVSSAAVTFAMVAEVPPITLAAWRLQLTSVVLGAGAAVQGRRMSPADRRRTLASAALLAASGTCLCFHFGLWVLSVETTSLTHCLLFVSSAPLFLAGGAWLLRQPISRGELAGTALGLLGAVLLATAAARTDKEATVGGDLAALAASLCFVGYLLVGKRLRSWMPTFVYAFIVTALAALLLTLGSLAFEGASLAAAGRGGVFGWAASPHYFPYVLYLALGPGIVGHTGFNTVLAYLDPLVISLACNLEPLIGSLLGWLLGLLSPPGAWTYAGGSLVLASTCLVSWSSSRREKQQAAAAGQGKAAAPGGAGGGEPLTEANAERGHAHAALGGGRSSLHPGVAPSPGAGSAEQQAAHLDPRLQHRHQQHVPPGRPPDAP